MLCAVRWCERKGRRVDVKNEWSVVVLASVLMIAMIHMTPEQLNALVKLYELVRS